MAEQSHPEIPAPRRRRRWLPVAAIALGAAFTGAVATSAIGQYGPPWGHWHGPGFMRGPLTPGQIEDRVDRGIRHAAIELDATPEQQDKLRAIAKAAVRDLVPMRDKAKGARERAEHLTLADSASKRFAQAVADAAEVLTPEQRQKAHEWVQWRRGFWHRWQRG
jgi:periplasmic protein CpxP/Spy